MKALFTNSKLMVKPKIPISLIKTNKMTLLTKINKINLERKQFLNKLSKQQFITLFQISSNRKNKKAFDNFYS